MIITGYADPTALAAWHDKTSKHLHLIPSKRTDDRCIQVSITIGDAEKLEATPSTNPAGGVHISRK